jgi:hypothetical protein
MAQKTRKSQYLRVLNMMRIKSVTAKFAKPQATTETAAPWARQEGQISGGGGDEPGRDEPADAGDAGGEERDVEVGFVCCETAEEGEDTKGDHFRPCG